MKLTITLGLLAFWVFALVTPSMITLIEKNESTFVFNLNEEEQKENVSLDSFAKQLPRQSQFGLYYLPLQTKSSDLFYLIAIPHPHLDIVLPPPERLA